MTTATQGIWGEVIGKEKVWGTYVRHWANPETGRAVAEPLIERPVLVQGRYAKGVNEEILRRAKARGEEIGLNGRSFPVPPQKELGRMKREGLATRIQGYFGKPFMIYLFFIS